MAPDRRDAPRSAPPSTRLLGARQRRRSVRFLTRYLGLVTAFVVASAGAFHLVMWWAEGERYSLLTGVYWALSTMTTLGLGDIVFESDVGRILTTVVLASGIFLFLVVLPFAFVRFLYAPWLEAPAIPERMRGHVIIIRWDDIAHAFVDELEAHGIPHYVIEPDPGRATRLRDEGISVVTGALDDRETFDRLRVGSAAMVLANAEDTTNTNVVLTVREASATVPIAALVDSTASLDILEFAGANRVLALKQQLGKQLANRVNAGHAQTHAIGSFRNLVVAEFPVHNTPFAGRTLRDLGFREHLGVNIVGVLEQTQFVAADPDTLLTMHSLPVVAGTDEEIAALDELLVIYDTNDSPVVVIGGGKVGRAAARSLRQRGVQVHMIERDPALRDQIGDIPTKMFVGNAAEREVLEAAGVMETPAVLLTTNDDAMNIYLAVYCRRLAPDVRIVSRITHDRNMEAIRRAGADLALSHASLAVESALAFLEGRELVLFGEGIELYEHPVPEALADKTLGECEVAGRTGLNVIAVQEPARLVTNPIASTRLVAGSTLIMVGNRSQLKTFRETFG